MDKMDKVVNTLEEMALNNDVKSQEIASHIFLIGQCYYQREEILKVIEGKGSEIGGLDADTMDIMLREAVLKVSDLLGLEVNLEEILKVFQIFFK